MNKIDYKFVALSDCNDCCNNGTVITPFIQIDKRNEIVTYGDNNKFPNFLLDLSVQSSLHTAILDKKIKLLVGDGFTYNGATNNKTEDFLASPNPYETMDDLLLKCASDLEIFNGFALQVLWGKDKKTIAQIYHTPFQNMRSGKVNDKNQVENYYYFDDWTKYTRITDTQKFSAYNQLGDKSKTQIFYCRKYSPTNLYYPIPSYIGGISDINTLGQISQFHNSTISNNFNPGIMIIFRGPRPTEEEQDVIMKALTEKYKGAKNAGTPSVFFLDNEAQAPQIEQTQVSDLDKQYTTLTEAVKESVVMAHSIPRILAGLEKAGSLGGGKEYIDASLVFQHDYVEPNQNFLLRQFNKIMNVNKLRELEIKNSNPNIMLYGESLMGNVLSKNEIREMFGYESIEEIVNPETPAAPVEPDVTETDQNIAAPEQK